MIVKKLTSFARDPMTSKAILRFAPILSSKVWQHPAYWCHIIGKSFIDYISSTKRPGWKTVWPDGLIICSIFGHLQKRKGTHEQKEVCQSPRFKICQILKIPQKIIILFDFFQSMQIWSHCSKGIMRFSRNRSSENILNYVRPLFCDCAGWSIKNISIESYHESHHYWKAINDIHCLWKKKEKYLATEKFECFSHGAI